MDGEGGGDAVCAKAVAANATTCMNLAALLINDSPLILTGFILQESHLLGTLTSGLLFSKQE
jgi:hypothetical protein